MKISSFFDHSLAVAKNHKNLYSALKGMRNQRILSTEQHIRLAAEWLLMAQKKTSDSGYSRLYSLYAGWDKSYIETSGYIIPTMLDVAKCLKNKLYLESAIHAGKWLLSVQRSDGAFADIDEGRAQAFDTGQVLLGLNRLYNKTQESDYLKAACKAGDWLVKVQDTNGSWRSFGYLQRPHAYYTRVAAALIDLGQIMGNALYDDAAKINLNWVIDQQQDNGYFRYSEFAQGEDAFLHTIIYILEGLLMSFKLTGETRWLKAALKSAEHLKTINLTQDLLLYSQYDSNWKPTNRSKCLTGLAQWACVCLQLYEITKDTTYFDLAGRTIYYLKSKQIQAEGDLKGALPGSIPLWGSYGRMQFMNWNVKFFLDALLAWNTYENETWQEQQRWTAACFSFSQHLVSDSLSDIDYACLDYVKKPLTTYIHKPITLLDLGCGKGKHLSYLKEQHPNWHLVGVDPFFENKALNIKRGSAYSIPIPNESVNVVVTFEVLQHISYIEKALKEIRRILKPSGILFIADRNPLSGLGLFKPLLELIGKWMYPWDSPFRERWYLIRSLKRLLSANGFSVQGLKTISDPNDKPIIGLNRYYLIYASLESTTQ